MTRPGLALTLVGLLAAQTAHADDRVRSLVHDGESVVRLEACFGFQTMIEFAPDERVETVGLGEAAEWQVTPNKRANLLFVKPMVRTSHSNMTIATDKGRYSFELVARASAACARGEVVYNLRLSRPLAARPAAAAPEATMRVSDAPPTPAPPERRNVAYSYSGDQDVAPLVLFDDGAATYFLWPRGVDAPAVYVLSADGRETLASLTARGDLLVVPQVAQQFVLRRGEHAARLFNDAFATDLPGEAAPRARGGVAAAQTRRRLFSFRSAPHD